MHVYYRMQKKIPALANSVSSLPKLSGRILYKLDQNVSKIYDISFNE